MAAIRLLVEEDDRPLLQTLRRRGFDARHVTELDRGGLSDAERRRLPLTISGLSSRTTSATSFSSIANTGRRAWFTAEFSSLTNCRSATYCGGAFGAWVASPPWKFEIRSSGFRTSGDGSRGCRRAPPPTCPLLVAAWLVGRGSRCPTSSIPESKFQIPIPCLALESSSGMWNSRGRRCAPGITRPDRLELPTLWFEVRFRGFCGVSASSSELR